VLPTDTHGRRILAADRHELLRNRPPAGRPAGLAPDAAPQHRSQAPRRWAEYAARQPRASR